MEETGQSDHGAETSDAPKASKSKRERSTIAFPYEDLESTIGLAEIVFNQYGGTCTTDQLAAAAGSTVKSGAFRSRIGAGRLFEVLGGSGSTITMGPLGVDVLDPNDLGARADAFLNAPLYRALFDAFRSSSLPNDFGLEAKIRDLGVSSKQVTTARQVFLRSAEQAGFFLHGHGRLVMPPRGPSNSGPEEPPNEVEHDLPQSDARSQGGGEPEIMSHPLIKGLLSVLPKPGEEFPSADKDLWLRTLDMNLSFIFKTTSTSSSPTQSSTSGASQEPVGGAAADGFEG